MTTRVQQASPLSRNTIIVISLLVGLTVGLITYMKLTRNRPEAGEPQVSYAMARAVTEQVMASINASGLWDKKDGLQRRAAAIEAADLKIKAQAVFGSDVLGPWRSCLAMVEQHQAFLQDLNQAASAEEQGQQAHVFPIAGSMRNGFQLGESYRTCRDQIERLRPAD